MSLGVPRRMGGGIPAGPLRIAYDDSTACERRAAEAAGGPVPRGCHSGEEPPEGVKRVLLHSCCAPCSGAMIGEMQDKGIDVTIFFYNPNIHPRREYVIRKEENKRYAAELGIDFVDADYDTAEWHARAEGMELDPERGARCSMCFDMRMERTIQYAARHGFGAVATTNATSRWKSAAQVDEAGVRAAARFAEAAEARGDARPPPVYWLYDWQTDAMTLRKYEISAEQRFYKQEYCGCVHSLRDSNAHRAREGLPPVRIGGETAGVGTRYFEDAEADAAEESQEVVDAFFRDAAGGGLLNERAREQFHQRLDARNVPTW